MVFDTQRAQENLQNILQRIRAATSSIEKDVLGYRSKDTVVDGDDEKKTMSDIRFYLLKNYRELDNILTELDRYK